MDNFYLRRVEPIFFIEFCSIPKYFNEGVDAEGYTGSYEISMMELFVKIVEDFKPLTIFIGNLHHRRLAGS